MHGLMIAIEYSYKLDRKNYFNLWCELGWLLLRQSQISRVIELYIPRLLSLRGLAISFSPSVKVSVCKRALLISSCIDKMISRKK